MKRIAIVIVLLLALFGVGYVIGTLTNDRPAEAATPPPATADTPPQPRAEPPSPTPVAVVPAAAYSVVSTDDNSVKAMTRPLASYTTAELEALPTNKRLTVHAAITNGITQEQVRPTLDAILDRYRTGDADLDEITVFLYSEPARVGQGYDIGTALWAPGGARGNVTPEIARGNDRSSYRTTYDESADVEAYLAARADTSDKFDLTVAERRAYYREVSAVEPRAFREADTRIDPVVDVMENIRLSNELTEAYTTEIRTRYGLTEEQHREIMTEGFRNGWPQ